MKRTLQLITATLLFVIGAGFTSHAQESNSLPYANYKGIKDLSTAKAEWIKDNPAAYQNLTNKNTNPASPKQEAFINYKEIKDPAAAKAAWLKDNPATSNVQPTGAETLKYYNYKGIKDLAAAKQAWLTDHPKYAKKMQGNSIPANASVARPGHGQRNTGKK